MEKQFTLTKEQNQKVQDWLHQTVYPYVIEKQKAAYEDSFYRRVMRHFGREPRGLAHYPNPIERDCWEMGYPYAGASGGGLTYEFTPTSLGEIVRVSYSGFPASLDLSDYDNW